MKQKKTTIIIENGEEVEALAPMILSVSRATDIPAFYTEWFFRRLEAGYSKWKNPFNGADYYVSFHKVRFIVFWSKNPAPLIPYIPILKEMCIGCYIQYTLNDYEAEGLEPNVPPINQRIATFKKLVELLGNNSVVWRFDPMILTDRIGIDDLLRKIEGIANELRDYTDTLVFSFADVSSYRKVKNNLDHSGINYKEWTEETMREFASKLSLLNEQKGWNFKLRTCCEKINLEEFGILHNRCIDDERIVKLAWHDAGLMRHIGWEVKEVGNILFGEENIHDSALPLPDNNYAMRLNKKSLKDKGQRQFCGCILAKDIGQYDTCPHGCLYCYANTTPSSAHRNYLSHNPASETIK